MLIRRLIHRYMEQAGADGASGGGAAGDGGAAAGAAAGAGGAAAGAGAAGSVLASGAAGAADGASGTDFIPEKLRVVKEDGTLDLDASSRKLAEAYGSLEKRFGSGEAPPKDASEYKITVPDALKEAFDPATDEGMNGFLAGAHAAGLNQAQVDFVMGKYFEMAPQLAAGAAQFDTTTATAELKKTWATDADFTRNVRNAYVGTNAAAQKAGLDVAEIMNGPLGNNPQFLRLMAALGPEFQEDPGAGGASMVTQDDINTLLTSEAYTNPRHPDHAKTSEKVRKYFERKHGTEAAG
jgi:hypothetical protein